MFALETVSSRVNERKSWPGSQQSLLLKNQIRPVALRNRRTLLKPHFSCPTYFGFRIFTAQSICREYAAFHCDAHCLKLSFYGRKGSLQVSRFSASAVLNIKPTTNGIQLSYLGQSNILLWETIFI